MALKEIKSLCGVVDSVLVIVGLTLLGVDVIVGVTVSSVLIQEAQLTQKKKNTVNNRIYFIAKSSAKLLM